MRICVCFNRLPLCKNIASVVFIRDGSDMQQEPHSWLQLRMWQLRTSDPLLFLVFFFYSFDGAAWNEWQQNVIALSTQEEAGKAKSKYIRKIFQPLSQLITAFIKMPTCSPQAKFRFHKKEKDNAHANRRKRHVPYGFITWQGMLTNTSVS